MPRTTRHFVPHLPVHIVQRAHERRACFAAPADFLVYLKLLGEATSRFDCAIHAYVLMTNHTHLLLTPGAAGDIPATMKRLAQRYSQYVNWRYRRIGSIWSGRYKAAVVQSERYLLLCQRYIELNPVRAAMVGLPGLYRWSSYRCNAEGRVDRLITPHPLYLSLGSSDAERHDTYRALFEEALDPVQVQRIRAVTNHNRVLGDAAFVAALVGAR